VILSWLGGCCGSELPVWDVPLPPLAVAPDETAQRDLAPLVSDDRGHLLLAAEGTPDVLVDVRDGVLFVTPQPGFVGVAELLLTATDPGGSATATQEVVVGSPSTSTAQACAELFQYETEGTPDGVGVAGSWNGWDPLADPMEETSPGLWRATLSLPSGPVAYKFVEITTGAFGDAQRWTCDPAAPLVQCDAGAVDPFATSFDPTCALDASPCNSMRVVADCSRPDISLDILDLDRAARTLSVTASGDVDALELCLDGACAALAAPGPSTTSFTGLLPGRHELRLEGSSGGVAADPKTWAFWIDGPDWDEGLMYFAFVDRLRDGDPTNNSAEGATAASGEYLGGDFDGLRELLPYLVDLGVTSLWLSNPLENAEGAWGGDCDATYAGYHAYWPDDSVAVESHFGDEAALLDVIDEAHALGLRVVVDWVGNHVHQDHPYVAAHPDWFTAEQGCKDIVNGGLGFDTIPETCWFAPYLPDFGYAQPGPLATQVADALALVPRWRLDGFRVDAVKHMSHAVSWNLDAEIEAQVEHTAAGGDEDFYTVGETFDGHDRIAAYVGPRQLDGQFDFPQYYAIRDSFAHDAPLTGLLDAASTSRAVFAEGRMGVFLGNHDVPRFASDAAEGDLSSCGDSGLRVAAAPSDGRAYDRLRLAFAWVITQPGVPLVYYGDEIGMPGYGDPDNRQPFWEHAGADVPADVEALATVVDAGPASVLRAVRDLAAVRRAHPALRTGSWVEWWREDAVVAYARVLADDAALVVINRSDAARTLVNGRAFAGLPAGPWSDALGSATAIEDGDTLSVTVPAWTAAIFVR
jgi:glycosidase